MEEQIKQLFTEIQDEHALLEALQKLLRRDAAAFQAEWRVWMPLLYRRSPYIAFHFMTTHLPPEGIADLLARLEADEVDDLFRQLYHRNTSIEAWNAEVMAAITRKMPRKKLVKFIQRRGNQKAIATEDTLLALWHYDSALLTHDFQNELINGYGAFKAEEETHLERLRALVGNHPKLAEGLYRRYAKPAEWHARLRQMIDDIDPSIKQKELNELLHKIQPQKHGEIPNDLLRGLISKFSLNRLFDYLAGNINKVKKWSIQTVFQLEATNAAIVESLLELRNKINWYNFGQMAEQWAVPLYERSPADAEPLIFAHLYQMPKPVMRKLLDLLKQGAPRTKLQAAIYQQLGDNDRWNDDLLELTRAEVTDAQFVERLQGFFVAFGWNDQKIALRDAVALALYRRLPAATGEFILHHVKYKVGSYSDLLAQAKDANPDFYTKLFRRVATPEMWKARMLELLTQDIPAERIIDVLEAHKPANREADATVLHAFLHKYGEVVLPFFQRYIDWTDQQRLKRLIDLPIDRKDLLRELQAIAFRQPIEFASAAEAWAIPLYERSADFFEPLLIRYINNSTLKVLREILARAERDGRRALFRALYPASAQPEEWLSQIKKLAKSDLSDEEVLRRLELRDVARWGYGLDEEAAMLLYERNGALFGDFIARKVFEYNRWGGNRHTYKRLLDKAKDAHPDLYHALLRRLNYSNYWQRELEALVKADLSPAEALAKLEALHPTTNFGGQAGFPGAVALRVVEKYGEGVLPYVLKYAVWFDKSKLLDLVEGWERYDLYWRVVFTQSHDQGKWVQHWNEALRNLADEAQTEGELRGELALLSPENTNRWQQWTISEDTALKLYERFPDAARPFIESYLIEPSEALFKKAEARGDELLLDYLAFRFMQKCTNLMHSAYPRQSRYYYQQKNDSARKQLERYGKLVNGRFDRLYSADPQLYVRHAALMLARIQPFEIWRIEDMREYNPIFRYMAMQHVEAWLASAEGMRELLESPSIFVQLMALEMLSEAAHQPTTAAQVGERLVENRRALRALLLGRSRRSTKRLVLRALEGAIAAEPAHAVPLLPLMEEAIDFYARNALPDAMMTSYVRLRHALDGGHKPLITRRVRSLAESRRLREGGVGVDVDNVPF